MPILLPSMASKFSWRPCILHPWCGVTTATKITFGRIFLIPVFIWTLLEYHATRQDGLPEEAWRVAAIVTYLVAALSDALDGWMARRYHQFSQLGKILDPAADKGLLFAALITLSAIQWPIPFPIWLPVLVISRDILSAAGAWMIHHYCGKVTIRPHWTGKVATFFQMSSIAWALLLFPIEYRHAVMLPAGIFTFISGVIYLCDMFHQLHAGTHPSPPESQA